MKTILIKILPIVSFLMSVSSCSDFLNTTPMQLTPETYFQNAAEAKTFLTTVYSPLMDVSMYGNGYPLYILSEDLGFYSVNYNGSSVLCSRTSNSDPSLLTLWRNLYDGINRANMLLENIDRAMPNSTDSASREQYRSEARFLRAFYYFTLVENFGDVPFRTHTPKNANNLSLARTDRKLIYEFITSEMAASEQYLPMANTVNPGHLSKSAAQGILARVYLFKAGENFRNNAVYNRDFETAEAVKADFQQAKDWAMKVKDSGLHGLVIPYKQIFIDLASDRYNSTGVLESLWEVEEYGNRSGVELADGRIGNTLGFGGNYDLSALNAPDAGKTGLANPGFAWYGGGAIKSTIKLYDMYNKESSITNTNIGDTVRGYWNIVNFSYTTTGSGSTTKYTGRRYYYKKVPQSLASKTFPYTDTDGFIYTVGTASDTTNTSRFMGKYRREYEVALPKNKNWTPENFPLLRYADVLLMIAEAENEINGPTALAHQCLNLVRQRAEIKQYDGTGLPIVTNKLVFRDIVKKERAMELCYEGTRHMDLVRWGELVTSINGIATLMNTSDRVLPSIKAFVGPYFNISNSYLFLPIPAGELAVNKAIPYNNPGW